MLSSRDIMTSTRRGGHLPGLLIMLPAAFVLLQGCSRGNEGRHTKPGVNTERSQSGSAAESVTIETANRTVEIMAGGVGWPSGIPADVPPFPYGTISSVAKTESAEGLSWSISVTSLSPEAVRQYEKELRNHGFQTSSMIVGSGGSVTGQNGNISIAVVVGADTATISVAIKK